VLDPLQKQDYFHTMQTPITVSTSATRLVPSVPTRKGVILQSSADIYVSFCGDDTVDTTKGFLIHSGQVVWFSDDLGRAKDAIYAVTASGTGTVKIEEVW